MIKLACSAALISLILLNLPIISADAGIPADIVVAAWTFDGVGETVVDISGNGGRRSVQQGDLVSGQCQFLHPGSGSPGSEY